MAERLYYAFDWLVGRELLDVKHIFNRAIHYGIGISLISPRWLPNGFWAYQLGVSVKDAETLARWVKDIDGDLNRLTPISDIEFDQSFQIFSIDKEGNRDAYSFYKATMSRFGPYRLNNVRDAMEIQRLLRKRLRGWRVYTMSWNLPYGSWKHPLAQKVNPIVKNMYQVIHELGGEVAVADWQVEKKHRFYVILPSYEALSSFTRRILPTLSMSIWSEILPEELPNYLDRHRIRFGLYLPGLE